MNVKDKIEEILKLVKIELPSSLNLDLYKIFYLLLFLIIYISNQHSVEKQIREINKLEKDVEELRTDYVTLNNNYMFSRKESEILKRVKKIGLENSKLPPEKISNKE
jgi:uncharacterized protein YeeX (DUF496 family)|tara:strand:+ start:384 stop:704 length:321 start_codon:yes stop_codon:yes gene_type:complete